MILLELRSFNVGNPSVCLQGTESMPLAVTGWHYTKIFYFCFSHLRTKSVNLHTMSGSPMCIEPEETSRHWIWRCKWKTDCRLHWTVRLRILTFSKRHQNAFNWSLSDTKKQKKKKSRLEVWLGDETLPSLYSSFSTIKRKQEQAQQQCKG